MPVAFGRLEEEHAASVDDVQTCVLSFYFFSSTLLLRRVDFSSSATAGVDGKRNKRERSPLFSHFR